MVTDSHPIQASDVYASGLKRCGKSYRLRWLNYLRPDIKRGNITQEEENLIIRLHKLLGNRWSLIAGRIPGRTDNEIKNYWNSTLVTKLRGEQLKPTKNKAKIQSLMDEIPQTSTAISTKSTSLVSQEQQQQQQEPHYNAENFAKLESRETDGTPLSTTSEEAIEFDIGELLVSDISDSEFLNYCQLNNNSRVEEAESSGVARDTCLSSDQLLQFSHFSEEMMNDCMKYESLG